MAIFPWDVQAKSYCLECQSLVKAKQADSMSNKQQKCMGRTGGLWICSSQGEMARVDDEDNPASNSTV